MIFIFLQHSLLKKYNNKCWSLYIFTTLIIDLYIFYNIHCWTNTTLIIDLYIFYNIHCWTNTTINVDLYIFYNIHCWKNTTINVDLYIFYNIHCWTNTTINVDLYVFLQHSLLNEYNNKCWPLYIFTTFIDERIQQSMLIFIYFYNIHYWKNTTINVNLYIFLQHSLLNKYNNKCRSLYIFTTFIVERIQQ